MPNANAPKNRWTPVQQMGVWAERCALESHHESALPSQRYRITREMPIKTNPIIPQDLSTIVSEQTPGDFPPGFLELNAPRQRPPLLGNPLFGYSCHPMPPPVLPEEVPTRDAKGKPSKASSQAMAKLGELQKMLEEERSLRKDLEAELAAVRQS